MEKYSGIDSKELKIGKSKKPTGLDVDDMGPKIHAYTEATISLINIPGINSTDLDAARTNLQKAIDVIDEWKKVLGG